MEFNGSKTYFLPYVISDKMIELLSGQFTTHRCCSAASSMMVYIESHYIIFQFAYKIKATYITLCLLYVKKVTRITYSVKTLDKDCLSVIVCFIVKV